MRRTVIIVKLLTDKPRYEIQDSLVSLVYKLLKEGDPTLANNIHDRREKFKPFTFGLSFAGLGKESSIHVSAINPEIIKAIHEGVTKTQGQGLTARGVIYKIIESVFIPDLEYISTSTDVTTVSPIILSETDNHKKKKCLLSNNPGWIERLRRNINLRIKAFIGEESNVKVTLKEAAEKPVFLKYKGNLLLGQNATLTLNGKKEHIETIVYGGIGERTASGFGALTVI